MTREFHWLRDYDRDRQLFATEVRKQSAPLKIILKTKDDPTLLRRWIMHHSKIVGLENIIIFDHGSINPEVEKIYLEYYSRLQLWRYSGFHNVLHTRHCNIELYEALRDSCSHYVFLDTDEFLALTYGSTYFTDDQIVSFIVQHDDVDVYPGVWLQNTLGYDDRFDVGRSVGALVNGLKWGKPIIRSHIDSPDLMHHNIQALESHKPNRLFANILVLHRSLLTPSQRIKSNLHKLVAYGLIRSAEEIEVVMRMSGNDEKGQAGYRYITEIHKLAALASDAKGYTGQSMWLTPDGRIEFQAHAQEKIFTSFIDAPHLGQTK